MAFLAIKMGKYWKVSIPVGANYKMVKFDQFLWSFSVKGVLLRCASHYLKIAIVIIYFDENIYDYNINTNTLIFR